MTRLCRRCVLLLAVSLCAPLIVHADEAAKPPVPDQVRIARATLDTLVQHDPLVWTSSSGSTTSTSDPISGYATLRSTGDINGDGSPDAVLITRQRVPVDLRSDDIHPGGPTNAIEITTIDPKTTTSLWTHPVYARDDYFDIDETVIRTGMKLNADLIPDIVVYQVDYATWESRLFGIDGATGTVLWQQDGVAVATPSIPDRATVAAAGAPMLLGIGGDMTGDGRDDIVLGTLTGTQAQLNVDTYAAWALSIEIVSGATGLPVGVPKVATGAGMAPTAAAVGDLNGDGLTDLAVADVALKSAAPSGAPTGAFIATEYTATLTVYSGATSVPLWKKTYTASGNAWDWGLSVRSGKIRPTGRGDLLLEWNRFNGVYYQYGPYWIMAIDGSSGVKMWDWNCGSSGGAEIQGDTNGDGYGDVVTWFIQTSGAPTYTGKIYRRLISGGPGVHACGTPLSDTAVGTWSTDTSNTYGFCDPDIFLKATGDLNGDGITDQRLRWRCPSSTYRHDYFSAAGGYGTSDQYPNTDVARSRVDVTDASFGAAPGVDLLAVTSRVLSTGEAVTTVSADEGTTGSLLWSVNIPVVGMLGNYYATGGVSPDLTGDGVPDVLATISYSRENNVFAPASFVFAAFEGKTGLLLWTKPAPSFSCMALTVGTEAFCVSSLH